MKEFADFNFICHKMINLMTLQQLEVIFLFKAVLAY